MMAIYSTVGTDKKGCSASTFRFVHQNENKMQRIKLFAHFACKMYEFEKQRYKKATEKSFFARKNVTKREGATERPLFIREITAISI